MQIIRTKANLIKTISTFSKSGKIIGFVPTMGALHDGHLSLIEIAKSKSDIVVVSIFVNPAQFAANEDFDKYPRNEQDDLVKLEASCVDVVYMPTINEIYANNSSTTISVGTIGKGLEGTFRPHFFDGVSLVVAKLFMQVAPDIAVFGAKDYQQLMVIKKLVKELDIPVEIIGAPICREADGLAMSSRNVYLSADKRIIAANIYKILLTVKEKLLSGKEVKTVLLSAKNELLAVGFEKVDYIELRDAETLMPLLALKSPARILVAARIGGVRLLDNLEV